MFHLKPFPESLPVRVALYRDVKKDLPSELTEVRVYIPYFRGVLILWVSLLCGCPDGRLIG